MSVMALGPTAALKGLQIISLTLLLCCLFSTIVKKKVTIKFLLYIFPHVIIDEKNKIQEKLLGQLENYL